MLKLLKKTEILFLPLMLVFYILIGFVIGAMYGNDLVSVLVVLYLCLDNFLTYSYKIVIDSTLPRILKGENRRGLKILFITLIVVLCVLLPFGVGIVSKDISIAILLLVMAPAILALEILETGKKQKTFVKR